MTVYSFFDMCIHRYFKVPYRLNVEVFQAPKKPRATVVLVHGIGNSLKSWKKVVDQLPDDIKIIGVDLLGFGASPRPQWAKYDAKTQARSLGVTLLSLRLPRRVILVGHSLGALVAVDVARRYPPLAKRLILCSPPFYHPDVNDSAGMFSLDHNLRRLYQVAKKHPERLARMSPLAVKVGLVNKAFNVTNDNVNTYIAALESSIINQTSLKDVKNLKVPITILYGALDPVVIGKNISTLGKERANVTTRRLMVGHEVVRKYVTRIAETIRKEVTAGAKRK